MDCYYPCTVRKIGTYTIWVNVALDRNHQVIPLPKEQLNLQRYIPLPEDVEEGDVIEMTLPFWALEHVGLSNVGATPPQQEVLR